MTVLEVKNLIKKYDDFVAVDGISFSVQEGEIVGLLGPNGAGKTTTINTILGILEPTSGKIEIFCQNAKECSDQTRENMNFAAVYAHLPPNLTVQQNLHIFGLLYGIENLKQKVESLLREFDLEKFKKQKAGVLSSGEASRLNFAKAIINNPHLLLLDEPTASLDPHIASQIRDKIVKYAKDTKSAVLWTSHNMKEIEEVCNRVMFLSHGKIVLSGDPKTLAQKHGKKDLEELFITVAREPLSLNL